MSWRPRWVRSRMDPAWRALGLLLVLPLADLVLSGNLLFLGDTGSAAGEAWASFQLLAVAGLVVGVRIVLDGRWRGAALVLALAWVVAHVVYDIAFTDSFTRFGERVAIARPWVFAEAVPIGAWLAGMIVAGAGLEVRRRHGQAMASLPAMRRTFALGLAAVLRSR